MSFNGSGTFVRLYSWVTEKNAGNPISSSKMDQEMDGMATGLSNCITKDGQTTVTDNIPFSTYRLTGVGDPVDAQDAATKNYVDTYVGAYVIDTDQVADEAITDAKLAHIGQYRVKGRVDAGSGDVGSLNANDLLTILGQSTNAWDANSNRITNVADPTSAQNAATKNYVDTYEVPLSQMADLDQYEVIGRISASTGVPEALTPDNLITILGQATGTLSLQNSLSVDGAITHPDYNTGSASGVGYSLGSSGQIRVQQASGALDTAILNIGYRGTGAVYHIRANGDFLSATNSYGSLSDRSIKRDISNMPACLDELMGLPLRLYRLNADYQRLGDDAPYREGVIADEVESAGFGDLVTTGEDGIKSVNYSGLAMKALRGLQELTVRVEALENPS